MRKDNTPGMHKDTICYRPVPLSKAYKESLSGTVTVNHTAGETVTLKSRSGRAFQNKKLKSVNAAQSRPNTLPEKKDGSTLPTQSRNKSCTTGNQHKGADIKQVAKLMTERYGQEEISSNSKDTPKQVPLWLVHQILNSDGEQSEQEKAKLFANGVEPLKSPIDTPVPCSPLPGCQACRMSATSNISGTNKQKETISNGQKKTELRTSKASIIYQNKATAKTKPLPIKSAPTKSQTFPRKKMTSYSTSTPGTKDVRSSEGKMAKHNLQEVTPSSSPPNPKGKWSVTTPPSTTVSNGFKFKVITPASRANHCREKKMQAYNNRAFEGVLWPLPLVHGDAVHGQAVRGHVVHNTSSLNDNAWISPPRENNTSTPCEGSTSMEKAPRYSKMSEGYADITSKQKLVVHVYS